MFTKVERFFTMTQYFIQLLVGHKKMLELLKVDFIYILILRMVDEE